MPVAVPVPCGSVCWAQACLPAVCFVSFKGPRGCYPNRLADHRVTLFHRFFNIGPATLQKPTLGPTGSQSGAKVTSKVTPNDLKSEIGSLPFRKPCNLDLLRQLHEFHDFFLSRLAKDLLKTIKTTCQSGTCKK